MATAPTNAATSPWLVIPQRQPEAQLRLFCVPYAGAGASAYHAWGKGLAPAIETAAIQLPGRETRLREKPFNRLLQLVEALADQLDPHLDRPFALFGHSLGALIAFEVCRALRRRGRPLPTQLVVSARRAPHLPETDEPIHALPQAAFVEVVQKRYNALPEVIRQDPELLDLFVPGLRADFEMLETYRYVEDEPLSCAIVAIGGRADPRVNAEGLALWRRQTTGPFWSTTFDGGHFYLQPQRDALLSLLNQILKGSSGH